MKFKIKQILTFLFILFTLVTYSQLTISNMQYQGNTIPNCGTINLGSANSHNISFDLTMSLVYIDGATDGSNELHWNGFLRLIHMTSSGESIMQQFVIGHSDWTIDITNGISFFDPSFNINLNSVNYPTNGGYLTAEYESDFGVLYSACVYDITKPKFKLNPNTLSVSCGSTGETFTVSNENNSPGNLSYQWSVGSGWSYNGNPVSNFTTSTNSVTLVPTTYPLSDVHVVPKLDGVSYPQLTSTVSLGSYNPNVSISGVSQICSTGVLFVNNLPVGSTVTSWHSPDTSIATISSINNHQGLIAKVNDGIVYISAKVENSCGQQKTIYKSVTVGSPNNLDTIDQFFLIEGMNDVVVETVDGIYDLEWKVNGVLVNDNGNDWVHIYFSNYPCVNNQVVLSARVDGICGWSNWLDMTYGECGFGGGMFRFSSNPISKEKGNGQIIIMEKKSVKDTKGYTIDIYNNFGEKVYSKTQRSMQFDISSLKKGLYIVKYQTKVGGISTKKLLVN